MSPGDLHSEAGTDRRVVPSVNEAKNTNPVPWRRLLLPTDHGSWAFVLEPVCLGLLVAFSPAAAWLGLAVLFGFIARKPAKLALGSPTTAPSLRRQARVFSTLLAVLSVGAVGLAVACSSLAILSPLALAVPGLWLFARQEIDGQTRSLLAELVGTGLCSLPLVAIALAGGWTWTSALSLGLINLARAWPTLLFIRALLRNARGETGGKRTAFLAQLLAPTGLALLATTPSIPWAVVAINSVLSMRALLFLRGVIPLQSAKRIGIGEMIWGLAYVIGVAIAYNSSVP